MFFLNLVRNIALIWTALNRDPLANISVTFLTIWRRTRGIRAYSVYAPSQWDTALQCNAKSHWLGAFTEWSLNSFKSTSWRCRIKTLQFTCIVILWLGIDDKPILVYIMVWRRTRDNHYNDVIMGTMASQITSLTIVYSTVIQAQIKKKHQSSASLAFLRGIHRDRWIPRTKGQ